MQGVIHENHYIFLYATMLHTKAPLLKEIYCESHRYEPWAVCGSERRIGRYVFPNVLYIERSLRDKLLGYIPRQLMEKPDYFDTMERRFRKSVTRFERHLCRAMKEDYSRENLAGLIEETAKILSSGIFKEVFEYQDAMNFLSAFMPVGSLKEKILALYQPLCIPHFLKFELKMHFFAEQYASDHDEKWVHRCIDKCAHLSCFLIEDSSHDDPGFMKKELEKIIDNNDDDPQQIRELRISLARRHEDAIIDAIQAESDILQFMDEYGGYTLNSKIIVKNCIKFIQLIATLEELKHIFSVQTAWVMRRVFKKFGMDLEKTDIRGLLSGFVGGGN